MDIMPFELVEGPQRPNISFNGRLLYSESSTPEKRVEGLPRTDQTLYIIASPLLFYGVKELLHSLPEGSAVAAVEFDKDIYDLSIRNTPAETLNLIEYRLIKQEEILDFFNSIRLKSYRKIIPVKLNRGYMLNRVFYESLFKTAESFLETHWKNRITMIHMGRLWFKNIFQNISQLSNNHPLGSLNTERQVVVAGAGESLEYSIDFLKDNRKRLFIIAADTAVSCLLENTITPDLVVVVEAQHANLFDFYKPEVFDIPAAFDLTSSPEILRKHIGQKYFFISEFHETSIFNMLKINNMLPTVIPPLGSVGITAMYIALMISKGSILYTGLDFSFIPDKYHAVGSPSYLLSMQNEYRTQKPGFFSSAYNNKRKKTKDKSGRTVFTDIIMGSYADRLNELGESSKRLIDIGTVGLSSRNRQLSDSELNSFFNNIRLPEYPETKTVLPLNEGSDNNSELTFFSRSDTINFLQTEICRIDEAVKSTVEFRNNHPDSKELPPDLNSLLEQLDYTWLFFPDSGPMPSASASFLRRFLFSASWFRGIIINALAQLN